MNRLILSCVALLLGLSTVQADDALDIANAQRAARGLPPFQRDPALAIAAQKAAEFRAAHGIAGHLTGGMGDFQFLPAGASADAAGCAMWQVGTGFGACAQYERYTFAGAATVIGRNGMAFHHLFVSNRPSGQVAASKTTTTVTQTPQARTMTTTTETLRVGESRPVLAAAANLTRRVAFRLTHPLNGRFRGCQ